jgi:hypothetical protein
MNKKGDTESLKQIVVWMLIILAGISLIFFIVKLRGNFV